MSPRRLRKPPRLKRRAATQEPKLSIYIFCEGKTEPDYFDWFRREVGNATVEVVTIGESGVPKTLVDAAVAQKKALQRTMRRRDRSSFDDRYAVWGGARCR